MDIERKALGVNPTVNFLRGANTATGNSLHTVAIRHALSPALKRYPAIAKSVDVYGASRSFRSACGAKSNAPASPAASAACMILYLDASPSSPGIFPTQRLLRKGLSKPYYSTRVGIKGWIEFSAPPG